MGTWVRKFYLNSIEMNIIKYQTIVSQGNCIVSIMFILFTTFTKHTDKELGSVKCTQIYIERGTQVSQVRTFSINNTKLNQLEKGDCCKYLEQDEYIGFNDTLNIERVTKEHFKRMKKKKKWLSELYGTNKVMSYNIFAAQVVTPTFSIINWTKEEVNNICIKTPKLLASTSSFHVNSNIGRVYSYRNKTGRALICLPDIYISRLVLINSNLTEKLISNAVCPKKSFT